MVLRYDDHMNPVGVRELKANLSSYIERARNGEEIIVMHRGEPVVKIVLLDEEEDVIARGYREGWLVPPKRPGGVRPLAPSIPDSAPGGESIVDWLVRDRQEETDEDEGPP
ncbi:MAG: Antitoxin [Thermoleophilia bacterium]|nr:Antitoxin [Thermoleophilia bacterium]